MFLRYGEAVLESGETPSAQQTSRAPGDGEPTNKDPLAELPTVDLHGVTLHAVTEKQTIELILSSLASGRGGFVVTPNLDHVRRCRDDLSFGALVAEADLVIADGMPLVWASKVQGTPLPARVAGSDLIRSLSAAAAAAGRSVFFLGGDPGTAEAAAGKLKQDNPDLHVAGHYCPRMGFDRDDAEIGKIVRHLVEAKPDIIFVALGSPKQEFLIHRIRRSLPGAWWLGVGISFSFVSGEVKRAPKWMQNSGLEWVHRLVQEPRKLFKRYIMVGLPFAASLMTSAATKRVARKFNRDSGARDRAARQSSREQQLVAAENRNASLVSEVPSTKPAPSIRARARTPDKPLGRLRAVVLLGGSVRQSELSLSTGRSLLDLPVDEDGSILNHWLRQADELARHAGLASLPVRVMVSANAPEPVSAAARHATSCRVERDQSEYRGTGGVLRDLAAGYNDDDLLLVANAAQLLLDPLIALATALDHKHADVALIGHRDGTPSGLMLLTAKSLRVIPPVGFVDMKEQALPAIAGEFDVRVVQCRRPIGLPIRSLSVYLSALRLYHNKRLGKSAQRDPLAEDWAPAFAIVEDGAIVDPQALVHDSVVLRGAVVEPRSVVVRSVVCPGAVVRQRTTTVDGFVTAAR